MTRRARHSLAVLATALLLPFQGLTSPAPRSNPLTADLGYATYTGYTDSSTGLNNYRGIRYAAPPVGNLRWQAPQPPVNETSSVTLDANWPPKCPQSLNAPNGAGSIGLFNEDCLYLSVIAPPDAQDLPVMVYIHGGGYAGGGGDSDFSEMIVNNINVMGTGFVLVNIQYRLGAFGFLSAQAMNQRGVANAGLWDQKAALQWVNQHIDSFGGDPNRITIAGESAGGGSVMTLIMAEGGSWGTSLFQNAIAGSPYLPQQYEWNGPHSEATFAQFAVAAGCLDQSNPADNATVWSCLINADSSTLQTANQAVNGAGVYGTFAFLPVTDGQFLKSLPSDQLFNGNVNGARILATNAADEGAGFVTPTINTADDFKLFLKTMFPLMGQEELANIFDTYKVDSVPADASPWATLGDSGPTAMNQSSFGFGFQQAAYNLYAEATFICPSYWLNTAFSRPGMSGHSWHFQYSVPPAEHSSSLNALIKDGMLPMGAKAYSPYFRLGTQLIYGNFIINDDPTLSSDYVSQLNDAESDSGFDAATPDNWKQWTGGAGGSPILNLNCTGGTESRYPWNNIIVTQYVNPGISTWWRNVDGYTWESSRGKRCEAWASIGPTVPA